MSSFMVTYMRRFTCINHLVFEILIIRIMPASYVNLYMALSKLSGPAYLLLYVDDIILTASSESFRRSIMSILSAEFAMKDLGQLSYFLGIVVTHHAGGLFLSQKKYAEAIIARAGMSSCKSSSTPIDT
ncbi:hypothetical protein LIER_37954 [Lithospermum erythrorhizon]|uniref:Reverse transcriptase Ty1/copia-type domain-containing protein n=1 Tax=Lithospermum erythrorhizon TaxID=34254 RepID=A0AAV3PSI0_LITER